MDTNLNVQNVANGLFIILGFGFLMYIGGSLLQPLIFATLFAIFLYPLDKRILRYAKYKPLSIFLSLITVLIPLFIVAYLFSFQLSSIIESLPEIKSNMKAGLDKALVEINNIIPFLKIDKATLLQSASIKSFEKPIELIGKGLMTSSTLLISMALSLIYTFLILLYRRSIKSFVIFQFEKQIRSNVKEAMSRIKEIVQSYVGGLVSVVFLLSFLNSLGLWIIGIDYPLFWGTLAGLLAVIPYVGTGLGGLLPFIYALATADHSWQPVAILIYYGIIQFLEGNIITPKIVGDKVDINPLFAILAIVLFGSIWSVGGVILALPIISILRIIFSQFEATSSLAVLMSSDVSQKAGKFKQLANT